MYGIKQHGLVKDALKEYVEEQNSMEKGDTRNLETIRAKATQRIEKLRAYNEDYVNKKRKRATQYKEGHLVMVKNAEASVLAPAYKRPYKIIRQLRNDRYIVADVERCQISQRPYQGIWEAVNMKPWRREPNDPALENATASENESLSEARTITKLDIR